MQANSIKPVKSWRSGGTSNFANWYLGNRVTRIDELKVGDVLFDDSNQFDALNLCCITSIKPERNICYAVFCNPYNINEKRVAGDHEFAIWDFDLSEGHFGNKYFRALKEEVTA